MMIALLLQNNFRTCKMCVPADSVNMRESLKYIWKTCLNNTLIQIQIIIKKVTQLIYV